MRRNPVLTGRSEMRSTACLCFTILTEGFSCWQGSQSIEFDHPEARTSKQNLAGFS